MIKVKVIENFHLGRFSELKNLVRVSSKNTPNFLYVGDVFECTEEMAEYLTKTNANHKAYVQIIEIKPENVSNIEETVEQKLENKPTRKRRTSKKNIENIK